MLLLGWSIWRVSKLYTEVTSFTILAFQLHSHHPTKILQLATCLWKKKVVDLLSKLLILECEYEVHDTHLCYINKLILLLWHKFDRSRQTSNYYTTSGSLFPVKWVPPEVTDTCHQHVAPLDFFFQRFSNMRSSRASLMCGHSGLLGRIDLSCFRDNERLIFSL